MQAGQRGGAFQRDGSFERLLPLAAAAAAALRGAAAALLAADLLIWQGITGQPANRDGRWGSAGREHLAEANHVQGGAPHDSSITL